MTRLGVVHIDGWPFLVSIDSAPPRADVSAGVAPGADAKQPGSERAPAGTPREVAS